MKEIEDEDKVIEVGGDVRLGNCGGEVGKGD